MEPHSPGPPAGFAIAGLGLGVVATGAVAFPVAGLRPALVALASGRLSRGRPARDGRRDGDAMTFFAAFAAVVFTFGFAGFFATGFPSSVCCDNSNAGFGMLRSCASIF